MTGTSNASNGEKATAKEAVQPKHGLSVLRDKEARGLVSLISDTLGEALSIVSEIHVAIYHYKEDREVSPEDLCRLREDALVGLSTSEHYLLMLGNVLDDQPGDADQWSQRTPYPVYMRSPEAPNGR
jgi:hypothetical protein